MHNSVVKSPEAWWRFGHVWLVIAGPAIVIVAGFVTLYLATSSPNEIVSDETYRQSIEAHKKQGADMVQGSNAPALQGRNHAATGTVPISK